MENTIAVLLTALGTFIATVFGKNFYSYHIKKQEIKSGFNCAEKIRMLEQEMAAKDMRTSKITTAVEMMLTMFESEFGEDPKYKAVIEKVKEEINEPLEKAAA